MYWRNEKPLFITEKPLYSVALVFISGFLYICQKYSYGTYGHQQRG